MWKRFILFLAVLVAIGIRGEGQDSSVFPFEYREIRLENGLKAYLIQTDSPGQVAFVTVVRTGSRDEYEKGLSGYAHFFEHMMFHGTERYPVYDRITGNIGALSNASTSDDFTQYYVVAASSALEQIVDLESDRFMNLAYSEAEFRTEAGAILGEFNQAKNNPYNLLFENLRSTAFQTHPYKHLTIGKEGDVRRMPEGYNDSLRFYSRYYRPENCVLLIAGDFDFDRAESLIRKYYSPWVAGYKAPEIEPESRQLSPRKATVVFEGNTIPLLSVNYKGPAWNAVDRTALAAEVLGMAAFGPRSDLYKKLVIRDRSVQSLMVDFGLGRDPGLLGVVALVTEPSDLQAVESEISETVEKFREDLCDSELVEDVKGAIKYGFLMRMETAQEVCFALIPFVAYTGGIEAVETYSRTLESITAEDVRRAARQFLSENGKTTVTLLPGEGGR